MKFNNISLNNIFKRFNFLRRNSSFIFLVLIIGLLICEGFVIKNAVFKVLNWSDQIPPITVAKGVRINFTNYDQVVDRIQRAQDFKPEGDTSRNPFYSKPGSP